MIRLCSCRGSSASIVENRPALEFCKSCGGKLVDGLKALSENMLSTMGLELKGVVDPHLNWKTATKGRQRAVRRARTSLTGGNRKNFTAKSSVGNNDATNKDIEGTGDFIGSDSEKVGVSILGRRFSDSLESVPIKKRRFLRMRSPSPPPESSHSDDSGYFLGSQATSYEGSSAYDKHCEERFVANKRLNFKKLKDEACDAADFSGISILAAAACDSDIVGDILNAGVAPNGNSYNEAISGNAQNLESYSIYEEKEQQLQVSDDLQDKCYVPSQTSSTSMLSADEVKFDGSKGKMSPTGILQVDCDKGKSSTRDSRLHWDLNIVMDAWDSSCGEVVNSEPLTTDHAVENGVHSDNRVVFETHEDKLESNCYSAVGQHFVPASDVPEHSHKVHKTEISDEPNMCNVNSVIHSKKPEESCSLLYGDDFVEKEPLVDVASVSSMKSIEESKFLHDQGNIVCHSKVVSSDTGPVLGLLAGLPLAIKTSDNIKTSVDCLVREAETSSHLLSGEAVSCDYTSHESHLKSCQSISRLVSDEHTNSAVAVLKSTTVGHCLTDAQLQPVSISNSQIDKHEKLPFVAKQGDQCSLTTHITEKAVEELSDGNICEKTVRTDGPSSEILHADKSSVEASRSPCPSDAYCYKSLVPSNQEELSSQTSCDVKHEMVAANDEAGGDKCALSSGVSLAPNRIDCSTHNSPEASVLISVEKVAKLDADLVDGSAGISVAGKNFLNDGKVISKDHVGCCHTFNTFEDTSTEANGMEKVELLEDDDSQYEDGEFRESILHSWGDGGAEEVETEQVDYESDNQENDFFEAVSGVPLAVPIDSLTCKDALLAGGNVVHAEKDAHVAVSQSLPKSSLTPEALDTENGKRTAGSFIGNGHIDHTGLIDESTRLRIDNDASRSVAYGDNMSRFTVDNVTNEASARMRSSGWDRLPEGERHTTVGLESGATVKQHHVAGYLESSGSSFRRDLSSRVERFNSSDETRRKDRSYARIIRYNDRNGTSTKSDRYTGSSGRDGPSRQGRARGKNWFDSPNHSGPRHHDSPAFFGASGFEQTGARNAAAAAVAKVESNGFLVAPDGTLVKAGGAGPASRMPKRSASGSMQSSHRTLSDRRSSCERERTCGMQRGLAHPRDLSPDRHFDVDRGRAGRYAQEMVRDRYRRPMADDRTELAMHHLSRSDRSFYPRRGPLRNSRSRTRSPSRSRTRSPRPWTSPRGSSGVGINGGPGLLRSSRSPNFRSNAKMGRTTSPHQRPSYEYRIAGYGPTSRTQVSPSGSRWADGRKVSPEQLREHEYKRRSGRSADMRMLRNHRFDSTDSQGRAKPVEHYRPFHSSRVPEVGGFGRGSRHDVVDDRRGHGDKYDIPHGMMQYDMDSNEKPIHYDVGEDFQVHKSSPKSAGFQRSGSPRGFDRGVHGQLGDSPPGAKEKGHFRYDK